jgi:hypothetical protein
MEDLEKIHDCKKCHGKLVLIEVDICGNTYCGYCHQRVNYEKYFARLLPTLKSRVSDEAE